MKFLKKIHLDEYQNQCIFFCVVRKYVLNKLINSINPWGGGTPQEITFTVIVFIRMKYSLLKCDQVV